MAIHTVGWVPRPGVLPALSIQQPFAEAILTGVKSIEIRTWLTPYRGRLVIHAGQTWYQQRDRGKMLAFSKAQTTALRLGLNLAVSAYPRGAIVGTVEVIACYEFDPLLWGATRNRHCAEDNWQPNLVGWELRKPRRLSKVVPYRGSLKLFAVSELLVSELLVDEWTQGVGGHIEGAESPAGLG